MRFEADEQYKAFNSKLVDTKWPMIGVRVPVVREKAKQLIKHQEWADFLQETPHYYEDVQLHCFVLGQAPMPPAERMRRIESILPLLDNWALVDGLCSSLKDTKKQPALYWSWLQQLRQHDAPFTRRFIIVMYLNYYLTLDYLEEVLSQLEQEQTPHYYVQMAVAWAVSIAYIKHSERVHRFLQTTTMPTWNFNKSIQKIRESRQIDAETKAILQSMRRR